MVQGSCSSELLPASCRLLLLSNRAVRERPIEHAEGADGDGEDQHGDGALPLPRAYEHVARIHPEQMGDGHDEALQSLLALVRPMGRHLFVSGEPLSRYRVQGAGCRVGRHLFVSGEPLSRHRVQGAGCRVGRHLFVSGEPLSCELPLLRQPLRRVMLIIQK